MICLRRDQGYHFELLDLQPGRVGLLLVLVLVDVLVALVNEVDLVVNDLVHEPTQVGPVLHQEQSQVRHGQLQSRVSFLQNGGHDLFQLVYAEILEHGLVLCDQFDEHVDGLLLDQDELGLLLRHDQVLDRLCEHVGEEHVAKVPDEGEREGLLLLVPALDVLYDLGLDRVQLVLVHLVEHDVAGGLAAHFFFQLLREDQRGHLVLAEVHFLAQDVDQQ